MPQETLEARLEVGRGPLAEIFPQFEPSTLQEANEIMALRKSMPEIKSEWLWTADFSMYRVEGEDTFLYFAPKEYNLIFRDIKNATSQLLKTDNYFPSKEGINEVVAAANSGKAIKIKISDLQLVKDNDEYGHFDVDPDNLDSLNDAQRSFVKTVYGNSKPGNRVYVLTSDYVKEQLKGKEDSAIARASGLGGADDGSRFDARDSVVGFAGYGLLGVLKEAPKAPQKIEDRKTIDYASVFEQARINPHEAVKHLTPETASGLLNVVNLFYAPNRKA